MRRVRPRTRCCDSVSIPPRSRCGGARAAPRVSPQEIRLVHGALSAAGRAPLPVDRVAMAAHEMGLITGVSVHVFNRRRAQWAPAEFDVATVGRERLKVDPLAVCYRPGAPPARKALMTSGGFHFLQRA